MNIKKQNKRVVTISLISILAIVTILFGFSGLLQKNSKKLLGDISYPTTNGVKLSCDKTTLDVDEITACTLTGFFQGGAEGVSGEIETNGNIEVSNITTTGWLNMATQGPHELTLLYINPPTANQFIIATMNLKGLASGTGTLSFIGQAESDNKIVITDNNSNTNYVSDAVINITISSGDDPTPTPTPSSDNTLKSLKVGQTSISLSNPVFTVPSDVSSVDITAVPNHASATVTGTGTKSLVVGQNTFPIVVTAENGSKKTYNLVITRETPASKSNVNTLNALTVSNVNLVPNFKSNVTSYTGIVENNVTSVNVSATRTDTKSTIVSGTGDHTLIVGVNTINIVVRAESGLEKTYSVKITRKEQEEHSDDDTKSDDNSVKGITIENATFVPKFDPSKNQNYYVVVGDDVTSLVINVTTNSNKATFSPSELALELEKQLLDMNIIVTAENGSKRYIPLTIVRESYYNSHKEEIDDNTKDQDITCVLELHSDVYQIDNEKLTINAVDKNHSDITIYNNIKSNCGTISVKDEKVTLTYNNESKVYTINRVFIAQTGQKLIKYGVIIGVLLVVILGLIFVMSKGKKQ